MYLEHMRCTMNLYIAGSSLPRKEVHFKNRAFAQNRTTTSLHNSLHNSISMLRLVLGSQCLLNFQSQHYSVYPSKFNCKLEKFPFTYIGLPLVHPKQISFWELVIDRIHKKLDRWKRFNISRGGRLTLCSAVLFNADLIWA